jgi:hypothetical protein
MAETQLKKKLSDFFTKKFFDLHGGVFLTWSGRGETNNFLIMA